MSGELGLTISWSGDIVCAVMKRMLPLCALLAGILLILSSCGTPRGSAEGPVVLDIGHCVGAEGARSPRAVNGQRVEEMSWWYRYVYYTKKVIEDAGYEVLVVNRGEEPEREPLRSYAERADVYHCEQESRGRMPSEFFPDRVGSGIAGADYAIENEASCAIFLHHNSARGWRRRGGSKSLIICNKYNGGRLARTLADTLEQEVLNHGMPNGGIGCQVQVRSVDAQRSASWMNACDDAGIPAAVIEAAFLNNREHVKYLSHDETARHYAETVGRGVVNYLRRYGQEERHYREDDDVPDAGSFGYAAESRRDDVPDAEWLWP